ncbi:three-helix bundle dimerization domain-containing protein [Corynebacterium sp. A21]|uniref:three-helix bundle dimerization domain-containing protein n=1 Tax=Corynebacterium sp. A21 TaxID=3457318 RepID=UPI003FD4D3D9
MMINKFDNVRLDLYRRFGHVCDSQTIDTILDGVIAERTATAKITTYLPVFVFRDAAELIQDHIWASGDIGTPRKRIHFVSGANPGQSIFAAAIARHLSDNGVVATAEAGHPENDADLKVEWILSERELDAPRPRLAEVDARVLDAADAIVLMGAEDTPDFAGRRYVRWDFSHDPAANLAQVRTLCDEIEMQVFNLLVEMGVPMTARTAAQVLAA